MSGKESKIASVITEFKRLHFLKRMPPVGAKRASDIKITLADGSIRSIHFDGGEHGISEKKEILTSTEGKRLTFQIYRFDTKTGQKMYSVQEQYDPVNGKITRRTAKDYDPQTGRVTSTSEEVYNPWDGKKTSFKRKFWKYDPTTGGVTSLIEEICHPVNGNIIQRNTGIYNAETGARASLEIESFNYDPNLKLISWEKVVYDPTIETSREKEAYNPETGLKTSRAVKKYGPNQKVTSWVETTYGSEEQITLREVKFLNFP